jgi:hypothetical protein
MPVLPPRAEPEPVEPVEEVKKPINLKKTLFWVGVGGTAVSGALSVIFWGLAASSHSDLEHNNNFIEEMHVNDPELDNVRSLAETAADKTSRYNNLAVGFTVITVLFAAGTGTIIANDYFGWELFGSEVALRPDGVVVRF